MEQWKKLDNEVDVLIRQKTAIKRLIDRKMLEKDLLIMKDAFEIAINVLESNDDELSELRLLEIKDIAKENADKLINLYKQNAEIEKSERGY
jgi:hypothetical protein